MFAEMTSLLNSDFSAEEFLFFDIETTGLDSHNDSIYLIGAMYARDNSLVLEQFFSEYYEDEENIINEFLNLTKTHKAIIHYNGTHFDIPFICSRFLNYSTEKIFDGCKSFDLFEVFKQYRDILNLSSVRQVMIEKYCGFNRHEQFSGGELIDYYLKYLALAKIDIMLDKTTSALTECPDKINVIEKYTPIGDSGLPILGGTDINQVFEALLLHNEEDVYGMLECGRLLCLLSFIKGNYTYKTAADENYLYIDIMFSKSMFSDFIINKTNSDSDSLNLMLPIEETDLKLFYENYRDYYYIPSQDIAIHKSLSDFYDKSIRQKATKSNCYNHCRGKFIKVPIGYETKIKADGIRYFKQDYNDDKVYFDLNLFLSDDTQNTKKAIYYYLISLVK